MKLTPIEARPTLAVLVQGSSAPVFRGTDPNGTRLLCGVCPTGLLAESVGEGDLYDIAFRCIGCGGLWMGPRLPPGRPLPWQTTVRMGPGNYLIRGTVEWKEGAVLASQEAIDHALKEIGDPIDIDSRMTALDEVFLDSLVSRAQALLGAAYTQMAATHQRGRASATPPKFPHRLMELTSAAETAAASFRKGAPSVDLVATVELQAMLEQLHRWRNHPSWPGLLPSLRSPQDFPHVLVTLAAASFLSDAGNGVELAPVGDRRMPDLRLHVAARRAVSTEVKAPVALQRPIVPLNDISAKAIVQKAFGRAGSGSGGQLAPGADGFLILGGYSLRKADVTKLETAARDLFRHYPEERKHVLGIAIVSLGALLDSRSAGVGHELPRVSGTLDSRIVTNPNYSGLNRVSREQRPGMERIDGLQEIEPRRGDAVQIRPNRAEPRFSRRPQ